MSADRQLNLLDSHAPFAPARTRGKPQSTRGKTAVYLVPRALPRETPTSSSQWGDRSSRIQLAMPRAAIVESETLDSREPLIAAGRFLASPKRERFVYNATLEAIDFVMNRLSFLGDDDAPGWTFDVVDIDASQRSETFNSSIDFVG